MIEITEKEVDKFNKDRIVQQMEYQHLEKMVKIYKKRINKGIFKLTVQWETNISNMDFDKLKSKYTDIRKNILLSESQVIYLNLDKVVARNCSNPDGIFPKDNLWAAERLPNKIASLVEFIENGNLVIPPIIETNGNESLQIVDGFHRIAICRFLQLEEIPFLIENRLIQYIEDLK